MICPDCKKTVPDDAICPCGVADPILSSNQVINAMKQLGSSRLFLGGAFHCLIAFAVIAAWGALGLSVDPELSAFTILCAFVLPAFYAVMTLGLFCHYFASRRKNTGELPTFGLSILWVLFLAAAVCCGCLILWQGIELFSKASLGSAPQTSGGEMDHSLSAGLFLIAVLIFFLVLLILSTKQVGAIRDTAKSGMADSVVFPFLSKVLLVAGIMGSLVVLVSIRRAGLSFALLFYLALLSPLATLSVILDHYRQRMEALVDLRRKSPEEAKKEIFGAPGYGLPSILDRSTILVDEKKK